MYFRAVNRQKSGEVIQWQQLAEAAGGEVVYHVPPEGTLVYQIQSVIGFQDLINDVPALCRRTGKTVFVVCGMPAQEHISIVLPVLMSLSGIGASWFTYMQQQRDVLLGVGIDAGLIPMNEKRYTALSIPDETSVLYTGFYWAEKRLDLFCHVAAALPEWKFTIHIGQDVPIESDGVPTNVVLDNLFRPSWGEYMALLARHRYVLIPRTESPLIYIGRSGLSAIASGATTVLPDVGPNAYLPPGTCVKYPADASASEIASLLRSRPTIDDEAVAKLMAECDPKSVCDILLKTKS